MAVHMLQASTLQCLGKQLIQLAFLLLMYKQICIQEQAFHGQRVSSRGVKKELERAGFGFEGLSSSLMEEK